MIFENVWDDAYKLKKKINIYQYGISFGFGVMGTVATLPVGGIGGLLSGLGFLVADKFFDRKAYGSFSEKIVKFRTQNRITHIYDFKKKYKLV